MSEDHMKSLKEMVHGSGIGFLFGSVGYVLSFAFVILASRYYGPDDYGIFTLAKTVLMLVSTIGILGITGGISRFIPYYEGKKDFQSLSGYLSFVFRYPLAASLISSLVLILFSDEITSFFGFPIIFSRIIKIVGIVVPMKVMSEVLRGIIVAKKKILYQNLSHQILENITLVAGILLIIWLKLGIMGIITVLALFVIIPFIFDLLVYNFKTGFGKRPGEKNMRLKEWMGFSLPLFFSSLFTFLINWTDNILVAKFLDSSQLGIYSIAFSMAMFLGFFQSNINRIFMPLVSESYSKDDKGKIKLLFKKAASWGFGLTFPVFLALTIYSKQILNIVFGKEFSGGSVALVVLSVGFIIGVMSGLNRSILALYKKTKTIFLLDVLGFSYNIVMNVILIPPLGILGAALASGSTLVVRNLAQLWVARKQQPLEFDFVYYAKFIIAGIPSAIVAVSIYRLFPGRSVVALILSGILYVLMYVALIVVLRTFDKEDIGILRAIKEKLGLKFKFLDVVLDKLSELNSK